MPANSRRDSRIRADAFTQDDVVEETRLPHSGRHYADGVRGDACDGLQVLIDERAVLRDDAGGMHRFQPCALHLYGIRFPAPPGLLERPERALRWALLVATAVIATAASSLVVPTVSGALLSGAYVAWKRYVDATGQDPFDEQTSGQ